MLPSIRDTRGTGRASDTWATKTFSSARTITSVRLLRRR
jgi:hypothetical protein